MEIVQEKKSSTLSMKHRRIFLGTVQARNVKMKKIGIMLFLGTQALMAAHPQETIQSLCRALVQAEQERVKCEKSTEWLQEMQEEGARCGNPAMALRLRNYYEKQVHDLQQELGIYRGEQEKATIAECLHKARIAQCDSVKEKS